MPPSCISKKTSVWGLTLESFSKFLALKFCSTSILLGLGLATLFRKACTDKNCLKFNGPIISEIEDKIFKHDNKCYKYTTTSSKCDNTKRIINVSDTPQIVN